MIDIKYATNNGHNVVLNGDSLMVLQELEDNSIDSVVTDPPYGLSFMGKKWDYDVPQVALWKEVFRVLKPGGHLLSFAGTRTYHRMAVNIEDAGFEIRDMISWLYGSGFPKSYNIGKNLDKYFKTGNASWNGTGDSSGGALGYAKLQHKQGYIPNDYSNKHQNKDEITEELAKQWEGWGTALKPACEPIVVARKPLSEKNIALNVLKHGTGGINIDGCRVNFRNEEDEKESKGKNQHSKYPNSIMRNPAPNGIYHEDKRPPKDYTAQGRFPANIILDEEAGKILDEQTEGKVGGASRFFYCAKASKSERNFGCEALEEKDGIRTNAPRENEDIKTPCRKNFHPTVKPIKLMQYLVRLVTPKNGVVLDPFAGSGTTGCACIKEGFNCILIERDEEYINIINARLEAYSQKR